jgi:hypothetical protein
MIISISEGRTDDIDIGVPDSLNKSGDVFERNEVKSIRWVLPRTRGHGRTVRAFGRCRAPARRPRDAQSHGSGTTGGHSRGHRDPHGRSESRTGERNEVMMGEGLTGWRPQREWTPFGPSILEEFCVLREYDTICYARVASTDRVSGVHAAAVDSTGSPVTANYPRDVRKGSQVLKPLLLIVVMVAIAACRQPTVIEI